MPAFTIPVIPKELTESYWNKRELLARKVKTGITDAIKNLRAEFDEVPWKGLVALCDTQIPDKIGNFDECRSLRKKLTEIHSKFDELTAFFEKYKGLYDKTKALKSRADEAAKTLLAAKYPQSAKLAENISKTAEDYAFSIAPSVLKDALDKAYYRITRPLDIKAAQLAIDADELSASAAATLKQLKIVSAQEDPLKRATLLTTTIYKGSGVGTIQTLSQSANAHARLGCLLGPEKYPNPETAKIIFNAASKLAASPPAVSEKDVDTKIRQIEQLADAAAKL